MKYKYSIEERKAIYKRWKKAYESVGTSMSQFSLAPGLPKDVLSIWKRQLNLK